MALYFMQKRKHSTAKRRRRCGECEGCRQIENCGVCVNCK